MPKEPECSSGLVEIVRSFSRKLNIGNYESVDFFCSRKDTCEKKDSVMEAVSECLHAFCKQEVERAIKQYKRENQ